MNHTATIAPRAPPTYRANRWFWSGKAGNIRGHFADMLTR